MSAHPSQHSQPFGPINSAPTQYPELNFLLTGLTQRARAVLGADFVGAYLHGAFAVGGTDRDSGCDFLIPTHEPLTDEQEAGLRALHQQLPTRPGHWSTALAGAYPALVQLRSLDGMGHPWLSVGPGHQQMQWTTTTNTEVVRWTLRERGITLVGPDPTTLVEPVPGPVLQQRMRGLLPRFGAHLAQRGGLETAGTQHYAVATCARMLHTLATGQITSPTAALHWALGALDPRWHPLLTQVLTDRAHPRDPRPRPGSAAATAEFARYAQHLASEAHPPAPEDGRP
ncbi:aminoglycoside adenylyltransferase domain-containing protein [Kocuria dechangensis]|nr:aminoglycoside adenylyltransferase domain-containing protein [Kocuria dechangensis]